MALFVVYEFHFPACFYYDGINKKAGKQEEKI